MTNEEWKSLLSIVAEKIYSELGVSLGEVVWKEGVINSNVVGLIGGSMRVDQILDKAAEVKLDQPGKVFVKKLRDDNISVNINISLKTSKGDKLTLTSFEDLATYLLLHEAGHLYYEHKMSGPIQEAEAEKFAFQHFQKLRQ